MEFLSIHFIIGIVALLVWAYVIFCLFYRQLLVDRILSRGKYWHIVVIFLLVALVPFAIGVVAELFGVKNIDLLFNAGMYSPADVAAYQASRGDVTESPSLLETVLFQFRGFGSHFYAGTEYGKGWALVIGILGTILFSGLLIPSVLSVIRMRSENYLWGTARYRIQRSPYAVIIGANDDVPELIHKLVSSKRVKYVIVQTTQTVYYYRSSLARHLSKNDEFHTILYNGGRDTAREMAALHLERAVEVYVLGEAERFENDADHDSLNIQCIRHISNLLKSAHRKKRMQCYVQFDNPATATSFQFSDMSSAVKEQIEFIAMNMPELWARRALVLSGMQGAEQYQPLDGGQQLDAESEKYVHMIVVGFSRQGVAMAVQAAHVAHFPNFVTKGIRTRISIIDSSANREKDVFMSQYENLFSICRWRNADLEKDENLDEVAWNNDTPDNYLDVEWEFLQGRLESGAVRSWLRNSVERPNAIVTVAICFRNPQYSQTSAFNLPREVYRHAVQVLVWQRSSSDIVNNLSGLGFDEEKRATMRYNKLRPFGMSGESFVGSIFDYRLAKLINYAYWRIEDNTLAHVNDIDPDTGLPNQESFWRQSGVVDQWSSNYNASAVPLKLRALGLNLQTSSIEEIAQRLSDPAIRDLIINVEHNRWNTEKLLTGYRALTADEKEQFRQWREALTYKEYVKHKKAFQRGWEMAHLDICSMDELKVVDEPAVDYDIYLTQAYPAIVEAWRASGALKTVEEK